MFNSLLICAPLEELLDIFSTILISRHWKHIVERGKTLVQSPWFSVPLNIFVSFCLSLSLSCYLFCFHGSRYSFTKAFCIGFVMTFFSAFDVPVFWPILLCYWIVLFVLTMRRQIAHMIKYKYVPFNLGKQVSF